MTGSLPSCVFVYAARYALGRKSHAVQDMEEVIASNLDVFKHDPGAREALIREIRDASERDDLGMGIDRESWMRTLGRLEAARG